MVIAASGLVLVVFLLVHLAGLGLALWDASAFERTASALHQAAWLPAAELGLLVLLLVHPAQALARVVANRAARGAVAAQPRSRREGLAEPWVALAGRLMPWSGSLMLVFLVVHLAQLRLQRPSAGQELAALLAVLRQPHWLALYAAVGLAVAGHLAHGQESAHRSLGLLDPGNARAIRLAGRSLALLIGAGFTLLPFALLQGGMR
ncbi:MAG: succinate dehydrogenase [Cyanobium sp.]